MSNFGLEVYDSTNTVRIDKNSRLSRIISVIPFTLGVGGSTTIPVPGITLDGTWAVSVDSNKRPAINFSISSGSVTIIYNNLNLGTVSANLIVMRF